MRPIYKILLAGGLLFIAGRLVYAWWNPNELVTFQGKDAPVAEVLNSFSKQTGRTILYPDALTQKLTLDLRRVPLEDALETATDQAGLAHSRIFLLSGETAGHAALLETVRGQKTQPLLVRMGRAGRWMSGGMPGRPGTVTYSAAGKEAPRVVADLNLSTDSYFYYGGGPIALSIDWKEKPIREAARELARLTGTDEERMYRVYERERERGDERPRRRGGMNQDFIQEWLDRATEEAASLPPAERAAAEDQLKDYRQKFEEFSKLSQEERFQRFMQRFMQGDPEQRLIQRLKNSTPESRAQRYKRWEERRQAQGSGTPPPAPLPQRHNP